MSQFKGVIRLHLKVLFCDADNRYFYRNNTLKCCVKYEAYIMLSHSLDDFQFFLVRLKIPGYKLCVMDI